MSASFELARTNHFNRAFLKDELLPSATIILAFLRSPMAISDTSPGTACGAPTQCPTMGDQTCDPTPWKCKCDGESHGCGQYGNFSCPNPVFGTDVNATATRVLANISAWTANLTGLVKQVCAGTGMALAHLALGHLAVDELSV